MELVPPMYNTHPYFSLKNLDKTVLIIHRKIRYSLVGFVCDLVRIEPTTLVYQEDCLTH